MKNFSKCFQNLDPTTIGRGFIFAALIAVGLERMTAIASDLHLWGDGVWYLLKVASDQHYFFWFGDFSTAFFRSRIFTILLTQTPVLVAVHLGIAELTVLSKVFGLTLFGHAPVSLSICYRYSPQKWYLLFPLLSLFAGSMNAEGYILTDSHVIVSLYWPLLFVLLFADELRGRTLLLVVMLSIPMVLSYESMVFFGVVLMGVCGWRWWRFLRQRVLTIGLALWYLLGVGLAIAALIWPHDPTNMAGFVNGLIAVLSSDHFAAKTSIIVMFCCFVLLFVPSRYSKVLGLVLVAGLGPVLWMIVLVLSGGMPGNLEAQAPARILNLTSPLLATSLLIAVLVHWARPDRRAIGLTAILIGTLGFGQAFWSLGYVIRWQALMATLRHELVLNRGPVPYSKSIMSLQRLGSLNLSRSHAMWPLLPLSIYGSQGGAVQSLIVPESTFLPFDPFAPASFPELSRYGVQYDTYLEALSSAGRYTLGETLDFGRGGNSSFFVHDGWSYPEDWARWTTKQDFELSLPIQETDYRGNVVLEADVVPLLTATHRSLSTEVFVNNVAVGLWSFEYLPDLEVRNLKLDIPNEVFFRSNPVAIRFHIREHLRSPSELGTGNDPRTLGLAFLKLRIEETN